MHEREQYCAGARVEPQRAPYRTAYVAERDPFPEHAKAPALTFVRELAAAMRELRVAHVYMKLADGGEVEMYLEGG